jgi:hypothetical protein
VSPQAALNAFVGQYEPDYATSAMVSTSEGILICVSFNSGTSAIIEVARFDGTAFRVIATMTAPQGLSVSPASYGGTPILVAHLTPGAIPDFLVTLGFADGGGGVVVSELSHGWQLVLFRQTWGDQPLVFGPSLSGATVVQRYNNNVPDHASGTIITTTFAFNGALFVPLAP